MRIQKLMGAARSVCDGIDGTERLLVGNTPKDTDVDKEGSLNSDPVGFLAILDYRISILETRLSRALKTLSVVNELLRVPEAKTSPSVRSDS